MAFPIYVDWIHRAPILCDAASLELGSAAPSGEAHGKCFRTGYRAPRQGGREGGARGALATARRLLTRQMAAKGDAENAVAPRAAASAKVAIRPCFGKTRAAEAGSSLEAPCYRQALDQQQLRRTLPLSQQATPKVAVRKVVQAGRRQVGAASKCVGSRRHPPPR